jgi:hypothetical protein
MADNSEPTGQQRAVDPFSSYNSNIVNQLTRIKTYAGGAINGVIAIKNDLQVELDSTASLDKVVVSRGIAYKDDMFLRLSSDHIVNFEDLTQYVEPTSGRTESGYYYVVLEYIYVKSRPAPTFKIKIIKPTQRAGYNWSSPSSHPFVFLKAVKHVEVGSPGSGDMKIDLSDPLFDIDPEDSEAKRRYIREYAGTESDLPTFNAARDASRIVYDVDTDKFWFGYKDKWGEVGEGGSIISLDTSGMSEGDLCYINSSGTCTKAISTALNTGADIVVKDVGGAGVGKGITSGIGLNVPVEGAISVTRGDLLYLSDTEDGKVTTTRPDAYFQVVGRSLTTSSGYVDIIFSPKLVLTLGVEGNLSSWSGPTSGLYYADIDISNLETSYGVHASFFDTSDLTQITPAEIQIISGGDTLRVFFPINTLSINYVITSEDAYGCGGGGGGGVLDHSALVNLSYATSGHIGFSPNPHPNSHHSDPASIPSGAIILFESDVAITGYSLLTTYDDGLVYITKGSGAAGESGATNKLGSTWSQPSHQHTGPNHQHDLSGHTHTFAGITEFEGYGSGTNRSSGGTNSHRHDFSGTTDAPDINLTSFSGTGLTGVSATVNTWRPQGRNFTRQQKI